jgi:CMP-N,N'-diacetyllegionaminic acid synthase
MGSGISGLGEEIIQVDMADKRILGVIPARGGSKGIPRKNIRKLAGKPLMAYVAEAGLKSGMITDLILSTDNEEIARVGRSLGLDVPFLRPVDLATDNARTVDVVKHAILAMEEIKGADYDFCVLLQPTNPLTQVHHIDTALQQLINGKAASVISLALLGLHGHPELMHTIQEGLLSKLLPERIIDNRHQIKDVYCRTGNVYAFSRDLPIKHDVLYTQESGFIIIEKEFVVNIDDELDWLYAEALLKHQKQGIGKNS